MASKNEIDYKALQKSVLTEHNRIRQDPQSYIPILKNVMKYFRGDVLYKPKEIPLQTNEGKPAFEEAIAFLSKQKPLEALIFDENLSKAAMDHVNDIGQKGTLQHESSDGKSVSDRIEMYIEWDGSCGENIDTCGKTGEDVIISFLIDDGVPNRGHRANLFKPDTKYVGIGCGPHRAYEVVTVLDYCGGVREKGKPFFDYNNFKYEFPKNITSSIKDTDSTKKKTSATAPVKDNVQFFDDEDAPEGTVSVRIVKTTRTFNGKRIKVTKKFYKLADGTEHIMELEEF